MTDIDFRDCHLTMTIGTRTKVSIYNHMRQFLIDEIEVRGFTVHDSALFNMLTIEERALRLAEEAIEDAKREFDDNGLVVGEMGGSFFSTLAELDEEIPRLVARCIAEARANFLADPFNGLDMTIQLASGTPLDILGTGKSYDVGLGPDAERP